jgi:hypothetical protein
MLYNFLTDADLAVGIKDAQLSQLTNDQTGLIPRAEASAVSWMKDYLGQRFDVADCFPSIGEWAGNNSYGPAQLVTPSVAVYGCGPAPLAYACGSDDEAAQPYTPLFERNDAGRIINYVYHDGTYYEALEASLNVEPGTEDAEGIWRERDPRDAKLVGYCVDITLFMLHKRVSPQRIPQIRIDLYNLAKEWHELVREGTLTPDLPRPRKKADSSDTIRWGSNPQRQHYY